MARPLRYEAAGAVYHVMARGDVGKNVFEGDKELVAALVRKRTGIPNRWVAHRQGMVHEVGATRAVRRFRDDRKLNERLNALEKKLEPR